MMSRAMMNRPTMLLVRAEEPHDPWRAALEAAGFDVSFRPVLAYEFRPPAPWPDAAAFDAVAMTSPRGASAVAGRVPAPLAALPWYAVGPGTALTLADLGLETVPPRAGDTDGTAAGLAARLVRDGRRRVLFLAGSPRRPDLERDLVAAGVHVTTLEVYRSDVLVEDWAPIHQNWAVFFSPRGVEALATPGGLDTERTRIAAIGPTTAAALRARGFAVGAVPELPTPDGLREALLSTAVQLPAAPRRGRTS